MTVNDRSLALPLWIALSRAHAVVEEAARRHAADHDLTLAEFGVLEALHHGGPMHLGELGRKILVSSGGISYLVDRLEERGLVRRRPCQEDRRAVRALLTPEGQELISSIFPEHARVVRRALSCLDRPTAKATLRALRRVVRAAEHADGDDGAS